MARSPAQIDSRRRQRERRRLRDEAALDALRAAGASCGTCVHFERSRNPAGHKPWCSHHSDWEGYVSTKPDGLCLTHRSASLSTPAERDQNHG